MMKKRIQLRTGMFAGCVVVFAALIFAVSCKALGDTGTEDEKKDYPPAAIPLESLIVEDSEGNDLIRGFQQNALNYEILFPRKQIGDEVVVKGVAASNKAEVLVSVGETIVQKDSLTTNLPEHSLTVKVTVTEETGRVSTVYQVLIQLDEDFFLPEFYGSVTINGKFDKYGLTAVLSSDSGVLDSNATFTWYRNDVEVSSVQGAEGKIYTVTEADNNAVIKVEVTADGKNGKLTAIRGAPRWESAEDVTNLIDDVKALVAANIGSTVVGDPAKNPHSYAAVLDLIETLNELMEGETYEQEVENTTGGKDIERFKKYDYTQIADKTAELKQLLTGGFNYIAEIIAPKLVFGYIGEQEQTVKLMDKSNAVYEIELTGASGGHIFGKPQSNKSRGAEGGGKGALIIARYNLAKGTEYTIRVGGQGTGTAIWDEKAQKFNKIAAGYSTPKKGGWPNGGSGGKSYNASTSGEYPAGSGGGGSTDIRLKTATGLFDGSSADPRFMVAAGGGGSAQRAEVWWAIRGAHAGEDGIIFDSIDEVTNPSKKPKTGASTSDKGENGFDYSGGGSDVERYEGRGGGGGGYRGGQAITSKIYKGIDKVTGSGAGGSNRIKMDDGSYMSSGRTTISITDAFGNGSARIQWIHN